MRERGSVIPGDALDKSCRQRAIGAGGDTYLQCGSQWYATLHRSDGEDYVEIAPPAGIRINHPSAHAERLDGGDGRYVLDGDTFYRAASPSEGGGYVSTEPPTGVVLRSLPSGAENSIPIVADGATYYTYDGRFYRRRADGHGGTVYELSESPF